MIFNLKEMKQREKVIQYAAVCASVFVAIIALFFAWQGERASANEVYLAFGLYLPCLLLAAQGFSWEEFARNRVLPYPSGILLLTAYVSLLVGISVVTLVSGNFTPIQVVIGLVGMVAMSAWVMIKASSAMKYALLMGSLIFFSVDLFLAKISLSAYNPLSGLFLQLAQLTFPS